MKKYLFILSMFVISGISAWQIDSSYKIVIPENPYDPSVKKALSEGAVCLQSILRQKGMTLPIVTASRPESGKKSIFIGFPDGRKYKNFSGSIRFDKRDIYITGNDVHVKGKKGKNNSFRSYFLGSIKAMTRFMELYLNVRFVLPDANGTAILPGPLPELPEKRYISVDPPLIFSTGCWTDMIYEYANNCYGRGNIHCYGGHSWYSAVPVAKYGKSNPEYYAVLDGRRAPDVHYWSLCISNPAVQELIYKEMLKQLDDGAEAVELAQTDGYRECECAKCKKLYNVDDPAERLWIFHTLLAKRLMKDRPGKKVMIIAYSPTFAPPKTFSEFPPNVIVELARYDEKDFQQWQKIKVPGGFITYIYNWGYYQPGGLTPKFSTKLAAEQVRRFMKYKVKGVYRCGFGNIYGLEGPVYYLFGKLFDDPGLDVEKTVSEYCVAAFGKNAAPAMNNFFKLIDEAVDNFVTGYHNEKTALSSHPESLLSAMWTPQRLKKMENQLLIAERAKKSSVEEKRLAITRYQFNYMKNLMQIQFAYQAYTLTPSKELLKIVLKLLDERALIGKQAFKGSKKLTFPGFPHIFHLGVPANKFATNGTLNATLAAPYTWNTKAIRTKSVLPGVSVKKMTVRRIKGKAGMDFSSGVWKNIPWEELSEIQLNPLKTKSRFKVAYDSQNLYTAIESDLSDIKSYLPLGKDGKCWQFDCVEMVVDPWGTREKYFHFVTNPVANSLYESAVGLIEDPLHPLFRSMDPSWNGKWSYLSKRKNNTWSLLFIIPFSTIGKKAAPGDMWCFNICREAFEKGSTQPELSCWSPCFEAFTFHEKSTFGELYFQ